VARESSGDGESLSFGGIHQLLIRSGAGNREQTSFALCCVAFRFVVFPLWKHRVA
jgi:hypothetical protein